MLRAIAADARYARNLGRSPASVVRMLPWASDAHHRADREHGRREILTLATSRNIALKSRWSASFKRFPNCSGCHSAAAYPFVRGIPPDQRVAAVRVRADRRAEDGVPASRRGRDRPRLRQPRHPVARHVAVEKLAEAVHNPRNHRYSTSKGIPKLREAVADLYQREFGVELDFETEVCSTIGAKEASRT